MSPIGPLLIASCQSGSKLARRVVELLKNEKIAQVHGEHLIFLEDIDFQFSDGETCVRNELKFAKIISIDEPLMEVIKNIHFNNHVNKVLRKPN